LTGYSVDNTPEGGYEKQVEEEMVLGKSDKIGGRVFDTVH
jgi:hypothetical protein